MQWAVLGRVDVQIESVVDLLLVLIFKRLRCYSLELPPSKTQTGATKADFLTLTVSPAGLIQNARQSCRSHEYAG